MKTSDFSGVFSDNEEIHTSEIATQNKGTAKPRKGIECVNCKRIFDGCEGHIGELCLNYVEYYRGYE